MNKEFTVLTEVELVKVDGGKRYPNCVGNFLGGLFAGAAAGVPLGPAGIVGGANLGMVGGALTCL
ncbi:Blp family class II bacteriocin [Ligilactobacillus salivarius]|nr:Blp family class II bacteriocin [Ligilactobacillus salivarius]WOX37451.1 Blp family class II bacteriocin [Ligilactobacillus salivarius]